jgi:hypothetical protein
MDDSSTLVTLFFAAILLTVSCLVVYRWSLGRVQDDLSGLMGAIGVLIAVVFIFSTGGQHINDAGTGLTKTVEIFMRPVAVGASAWTGFTFAGTTGLTVALVLTLPGLFPGVELAKSMYNTTGSVLSSLNPFSWFKKKAADVPALPKEDNPFIAGRRRSRR